jgi:hypothetical protein
MRQSIAGKDMNMEAEESGIYSVGSRYHPMTGEDTAGSEDLVCGVVNCRVCEFATAL